MGDRDEFQGANNDGEGGLHTGKGAEAEEQRAVDAIREMERRMAQMKEQERAMEAQRAELTMREEELDQRDQAQETQQSMIETQQSMVDNREREAREVYERVREERVREGFLRSSRTMRSPPKPPIGSPSQGGPRSGSGGGVGVGSSGGDASANDISTMVRALTKALAPKENVEGVLDKVGVECDPAVEDYDFAREQFLVDLDLLKKGKYSQLMEGGKISSEWENLEDLEAWIQRDNQIYGRLVALFSKSEVIDEVRAVTRLKTSDASRIVTGQMRVPTDFSASRAALKIFDEKHWLLDENDIRAVEQMVIQLNAADYSHLDEFIEIGRGLVNKIPRCNDRVTERGIIDWWLAGLRQTHGRILDLVEVDIERTLETTGVDMRKNFSVLIKRVKKWQKTGSIITKPVFMAGRLIAEGQGGRGTGRDQRDVKGNMSSTEVRERLMNSGGGGGGATPTGGGRQPWTEAEKKEKANRMCSNKHCKRPKGHLEMYCNSYNGGKEGGFLKAPSRVFPPRVKMKMWEELIKMLVQHGATKFTPEIDGKKPTTKAEYEKVYYPPWQPGDKKGEEGERAKGNMAGTGNQANSAKSAQSAQEYLESLDEREIVMMAEKALERQQLREENKANGQMAKVMDNGDGGPENNEENETYVEDLETGRRFESALALFQQVAAEKGKKESKYVENATTRALKKLPTALAANEQEMARGKTESKLLIDCGADFTTLLAGEDDDAFGEDFLWFPPGRFTLHGAENVPGHRGTNLTGMGTATGVCFDKISQSYQPIVVPHSLRATKGGVRQRMLATFNQKWQDLNMNFSTGYRNDVDFGTMYDDVNGFQFEAEREQIRGKVVGRLWFLAVRWAGVGIQEHAPVSKLRSFHEIGAASAKAKSPAVDSGELEERVAAMRRSLEDKPIELKTRRGTTRLTGKKDMLARVIAIREQLDKLTKKTEDMAIEITTAVEESPKISADTDAEGAMSGEEAKSFLGKVIVNAPTIHENLEAHQDCFHTETSRICFAVRNNFLEDLPISGVYRGDDKEACCIPCGMAKIKRRSLRQITNSHPKVEEEAAGRIKELRLELRKIEAKKSDRFTRIYRRLYFDLKIWSRVMMGGVTVTSGAIDEESGDSWVGELRKKDEWVGEVTRVMQLTKNKLAELKEINQTILVSPPTLISDQDSVMTGKKMQSVAIQTGMTMQLAPPRTAYLNQFIERLWQELNGMAFGAIADCGLPKHLIARLVQRANFVRRRMPRRTNVFGVPPYTRVNNGEVPSARRVKRIGCLVLCWLHKEQRGAQGDKAQIGWNLGAVEGQLNWEVYLDRTNRTVMVVHCVFIRSITYQERQRYTIPGYWNSGIPPTIVLRPTAEVQISANEAPYVIAVEDMDVERFEPAHFEGNPPVPPENYGVVGRDMEVRKAFAPSKSGTAIVGSEQGVVVQLPEVKLKVEEKTKTPARLDESRQSSPHRGGLSQLNEHNESENDTPFLTDVSSTSEESPFAVSRSRIERRNSWMPTPRMNDLNETLNETRGETEQDEDKTEVDNKRSSRSRQRTISTPWRSTPKREELEPVPESDEEHDLSADSDGKLEEINDWKSPDSFAARVKRMRNVYQKRSEMLGKRTVRPHGSLALSDGEEIKARRTVRPQGGQSTGCVFVHGTGLMTRIVDDSAVDEAKRRMKQMVAQAKYIEGEKEMFSRIYDTKESIEIGKRENMRMVGRFADDTYADFMKTSNACSVEVTKTMYDEVVMLGIPRFVHEI